MELSQTDKLVLCALIWSLKPSDLSILQAYLRQKGDAEIGTAKNSGNDIFYSHLAGLGLARETTLSPDPPEKGTPALAGLKAFTLTEQGKAELSPLIEIVLIDDASPPRHAIVSPEAVRILMRYAADGNAASQTKLGLLYQDGSGVEQNHTEALKWYKEAAANGDVTAHNNIGVMYFGGFGVARNIGEAFKWFLKAAELGSTGAMDNIGEMYSHGLGVAQDYSKAFEWFQHAAEHGYGPATVKLASMCSTGRGVPQDYVQAYMWFTLGIIAEIEDAGEKRNAIASKMTPAQIEQGELLAAQWMADKER